MAEKPVSYNHWDHPPHATRHWTSSKRPNMQNDYEYKGLSIVQNDYHNLHGNIDTFGFTVNQAYVVTDEMGDPGLPTIQQWFWSPYDAIVAIDLSEYFKARVPQKKWPTTVAHEFNIALCFRKKFGLTYIALREIEEACKDADSMGEDAGPAVLKILDSLKRAVMDNGTKLK